MKKTVIVVLMFCAFISCKNESKSEDKNVSEDNKQMTANGKTDLQKDGLITLQGNFIYYDDAAVLQTPTHMYGVVINDKMHELDKQVQPYKTEFTDMVPVTVRVRKFKKPENEEGWEDRIEIKDILKVSKPNPEDNDVIKLENKPQ